MSSKTRSRKELSFKQPTKVELFLLVAMQPETKTVFFYNISFNFKTFRGWIIIFFFQHTSFNGKIFLVEFGQWSFSPNLMFQILMLAKWNNNIFSMCLDISSKARKLGSWNRKALSSAWPSFGLSRKKLLTRISARQPDLFSCFFLLDHWPNAG